MENWSWRPVKFWTDEWTGTGLVERYALHPLDQSQKIDLVLDFLRESRWNFEKLCNVLPVEVIQRILGIYVAVWEMLWIEQYRLLVVMVGSQLVMLTPTVKNDYDSQWRWGFIWMANLPENYKPAYGLCHGNGKLVTVRGLANDSACCQYYCESALDIWDSLGVNSLMQSPQSTLRCYSLIWKSQEMPEGDASEPYCLLCLVAYLEPQMQGRL